jgi:hypothetical protein
MKFPVFSQLAGNFRDEFARDCLLQQRVSNELVRRWALMEPDRDGSGIRSFRPPWSVPWPSGMTSAANSSRLSQMS